MARRINRRQMLTASAATLGYFHLAPAFSAAKVDGANGKVLFSDRFVKPNYSADLSELTGKLSAFSSVSTPMAPNMADLELRGQAVLERLAQAREQFRGHLAELHTYARQSQEDLQALRAQVHADCRVPTSHE